MTSTQVENANPTGTFGSRVATLLHERHSGKPLTLVAEETGLGYATLQKALRDDTQPRYSTVAALAKYLGCSVSFLVDGRERPTNGQAPGGNRAVQFLALVRRRPGIKAAEIGRELGMKTGYVYHVASRLLEEGYVRKDKKHRYFIAQSERHERPTEVAATVPAPAPEPKPKTPAPEPEPEPQSATSMASNGYREGYRDGYADAVKMLAERPMTVEQLLA